MTTLIDKLRAANTGSPELSAEVFKHINHAYRNWTQPLNDRILFCEDTKDLVTFSDFTGSIDRALTLMPDGYSFIAESFSDGYAFQLYDCSDWEVSTARHKSLPIAICIAVLSANKQREV